MDEQLRQLERQAAMGDPTAANKLRSLQLRSLQHPAFAVEPAHCQRDYSPRLCFATSPYKYNECYCDCQGCLAARGNTHCANRSSKVHGYCSLMRGFANCTCDCACCTRTKILQGKIRRNPDDFCQC